MKNLIHLTEDRHVYKQNEINDVIKCHIPNPNFTQDDAFDTTSSIPSHYILTQSGHLHAIASSSNILWSTKLSNMTNPEVGDDVGDSDTSWFHLWYDENSDSLVALSHSGNIVSINPFAFAKKNNNDGGGDGSGDDVGELIGKFDFGIACAAWSVDGEVLALITYSYVPSSTFHNESITPNQQDEKMEAEGEIYVPTLMTMNTQFEILAEEHLPPNTAATNISATMEEKDSEESIIHICWNQKHDNSLVAVSSHDMNDKTRKIRIYKGESLELISISRTEDGSGKLIPNLMSGTTKIGNHHIMAWAGGNTSNLLACIQRKGRKGRNVVFLEQNGLQHGGFKLDQRNDCEEVVGLDWNAQSDLLAVTYIGTMKGQSDGDSVAEDLTYGKVQLYHRCNYHWYLKHELQYDSGTTISSIGFDSVRGYDLSLILHRNGDMGHHEWRHYVFVWDVSTIAPRNGMATVVDGCHLNLTMFHKAIVPPPMYTARLSFGSSIIGVAHNPSSEGEIIHFVTHLSDGTVVLCGKSKDEGEKEKSWRSIVKPVILSKFNLSSVYSDPDWDASKVHQLIIVDAVEDENNNSVNIALVAALTSNTDSREKIVVMTVRVSLSEGENTYVTELIDVQDFHLEGKVLRIVNWSDAYDHTVSGDPGCLLELTEGSLYQISISSTANTIDIVPCESESLLLEPCPWVAGVRNASDGRQIVIGLSSRCRLYCGERQLCDASSSFCLSPKTGFLSYVTLGSRSQLRFLPLEILKNFDPFMGSDENLEILGEGYEPRNVERGSRLVSILPDQITAVLQLPRGNLEGVYPRALVLPRIMSYIKEGEYHFALDMMRRQKVDMNLIVDMNPTIFLSSEKGVQTMVRQVQKIDHLNLFLACLQNLDITIWKYPIPKWLNDIDSAGMKNEFNFATKVNGVCEKMRMAMIELESSGECDEGKYLLPILSTFAKQEPAKLEDALSLIKENAVKIPSTKSMKSILLSDKVQSSIQYLAFLANYELLFNTALGMYDFDLAKAVARNSQMDPKIYLPLVKRLKNLPEFEAKYEVDLKLKRYESALTNLFKSGTRAVENEYEKPDIDEEHFTQCKAFVEKHNLYELGLELFISYPNWHRQILVSMGDNLLREHKADLALSVFLAAKPIDYDGAKRAARTCGDWKTFFSCVIENSSPENISDIASTVSEEVLSGRGGVYNTKRERNAAAARILLDYCQDVSGAIEILTNAELWFEARRQSCLHDKSYMKGIIDASVDFCHSCLPDFEERIEKFNETNSRYIEVLFIRRQAKRDGEAMLPDNENDETGSLFSLASNASNASVRSNMSTSSISSTSSLSSVISAGGNSTFNVINNDDEYRHRSKFNKKSKKKKNRKTRRERMQIKPGSEDELKNLVGTLKTSIIEGEYFETILETIKFLAQVDMLDFSKMLYESYTTFRKRIEEIKEDRIKQINEKAIEEEIAARNDGQFYEKVTLECEDEVNKLGCQDIPENTKTFFQYKIA